MGKDTAIFLKLKAVVLLAAIMPLSPVMAQINVFKPYAPLTEIPYLENLRGQKDSLSIMYQPDGLMKRYILSLSMFTTAALSNDNILDRSIIREGRPGGPKYLAANYTQYMPLAAVMGLKLAGVEGRSDWVRLITESLFSYGATGVLGQGLKYTVRRYRPDCNARNSFPSGHTTTAFMGATVLHREYGETVSPWISVARYSVATATAAMRVLANRHWLSDALAGASIGILGTEIAYDVNDALFGPRHLVKPIRHTYDRIQTPWHFGIQSSVSLKADVSDSKGTWNTDAAPAYTTAVTATWKPKHIGPTLYAGFTQIQWTGKENIIRASGDNVHDIACLGAGLSAEIPLARRLFIEGQAIGGWCPATDEYRFSDMDGNLIEWKLQDTPRLIGNLGMSVRTSDYGRVSIFAGYDNLRSVWKSWTAGTGFSFVF